MRPTSTVAALVLLCAEASSAHSHAHRRHTHSHSAKLAKIHAEVEQAGVEKRKSTCTLPDHSDLHFVPGDVNNGFAMSPDQACEDGMYCPIACKPGKVMAQWEAGTTYKTESMNGGLYCEGGTAKKPFEDKPYCVDGTGTVKVENKMGKKCSFCQTVLPGNEAMLIPTVVDDSATLAVPDPSYWDGTSAHYYINPPGTGEEGCIWGDESKPIGNWAPYVAGANTDKDGQTFLKLGFNPIYEHEGDGLDKSALNFGVRVDCPDGGCNGMPCELNPSKKTYGEVISKQGAIGAGTSSFCVATVPSGSKANIVVFNLDGSEGDSGEDENDSYDEEPTSTSSESSGSDKADGETSGSSGSSGGSPTVGPGVFREGDDSDGSGSSPTGSSGTDEDDDAEEGSEENNAPGRQSSAAVAGLVVALAAASCLY